MDVLKVVPGPHVTLGVSVRLSEYQTEGVACVSVRGRASMRVSACTDGDSAGSIGGFFKGWSVVFRAYYRHPST